MQHNHSDLVTLFNQCFEQQENTQLIAGADEPLYEPADAQHPLHRLFFTRDYYASALHEIAHWCIAGTQRRLQTDYGYWYAPDGRSEAQQQLFEKVEVKPQAIEWIFAQACGLRFRVSADNLSAGLGASDSFKTAIWQQSRHYLEQDQFPPRAQQFTRALCQFYQNDYPEAGQFLLSCL